ncbi:hypothetical protein GYW21_09300 [Lactobacillus mellis]|nr:hypothetical protein [Bombilactobacillus mellis]
MIIDAGQLVSSDALGTDTQVKDTDIDKSITAQLSDNSGGDSSADLHDNSKKLPPIYYVRLNALNAKRSTRNWTNDSQLVRDLFVNDNLKKYKKVQKKTKRNFTMDTVHSRKWIPAYRKIPKMKLHNKIVRI